MSFPTKILIFCVILSNAILAGCIYSERANDSAAERLRQNLVNEDFAEIYKRASWVTRAQLSHDEFVSTIKKATAELKRTDPEIKWTRNQTILYDRSVFREDNFSSLDLAKDGKRLNVTLDWAAEYALWGMSILYDDLGNGSGNGVKVFRNCD